MRSRLCTVSRKNVTLINFAQSRMYSLVSIDFSCNVSEFQDTAHFQSISPREVIRAWFREKTQWS
ncbi:hypothetical protein GW17_00046007 [Ensete ventricosum]|nr:hypothetical protein GW17_00046007 [Ensete ventricosum]